jgi:hypothetical protein
MNTPAADPADRLAAAAASEQGVVAWYAQGFSDRFGDRLLLFDNTGSQPLELLRLAERLTASPEFEPALRERVERLQPFDHPAFARVRGVSVLAEPVPQLALVSDHIPGERLSTILRAAQARGFQPDPGTANWLLRRLMPAVAALHDMGAGIAHGTLSPERIVVTPTGDLIVTEYVFAHAVERLETSPDALWRTLGVAVQPERPALDQRNDIRQVALLALAVLLGRPLRPHEFPARIGDLLDEACDEGRWSFVAPLRAWLGRALNAGSLPPFDSAAHALTTLEELLPRISGAWTPRLLPQNLDTPGAAAAPLPIAATPQGRRPATSTSSEETARSEQGPARPRSQGARQAPGVDALDLPSLVATLRRRNRILAAVAAVEAACLVGLLLRPAPATPSSERGSATVTVPVVATLSPQGVDGAPAGRSRSMGVDSAVEPERHIRPGAPARVVSAPSGGQFSVERRMRVGGAGESRPVRTAQGGGR